MTGAGTSFWIDAVHERQAQFTGSVSLAVARETVCLARCSRPPKGPPGSRRYASLYLARIPPSARTLARASRDGLAGSTGPIARGLSLIAIVVGGLMFAFGEGGSKRTLAGIIFGLGMAMGAANFLAWLF